MGSGLWTWDLAWMGATCPAWWPWDTFAPCASYTSVLHDCLEASCSVILIILPPPLLPPSDVRHISLLCGPENVLVDVLRFGVFGEGVSLRGMDHNWNQWN